METYRSPWFNLEGYLACTVKYDDGSKRTILQHREVMEGVLGRRLDPWETVHHVDEDRRNNHPSNLELKDKVSHGKHHAKVENVVLICVACGTAFVRKARAERRRVKRGCAGPYCGKECVGRSVRVMQLVAARS